FETVRSRVSDPAFFVSRLCGAGSPTRHSLFRNCVEPGLRPGFLFRNRVEPGLRPGFLCFEIVWCRVSDPAFFVSKLCGAGSPTRLSFSKSCGAGSPTRLSFSKSCRAGSPTRHFLDDSPVLTHHHSAMCLPTHGN